MTPYQDKTLKDTMKEERKKLRDMSFRDKCWYIWEYYKFPIIGILVAILLVISIGMTIYNNRFETALSCVILNSQSSAENTVSEFFNDGFGPYMNLGEEEKIDVDYSMSLTFDENAMSDFTYAELAKISAMVTSKELDVMIGKEDTIEHYGEMGGFLDLSEFLPADVYDKVKDKLYYVTDQETGKNIAAGIYVEDTGFEEKTGLTLDQPILGIMSNSTRTDTALKLIRYMFGL